MPIRAAITVSRARTRTFVRSCRPATVPPRCLAAVGRALVRGEDGVPGRAPRVQGLRPNRLPPAKQILSFCHPPARGVEQSAVTFQLAPPARPPALFPAAPEWSRHDGLRLALDPRAAAARRRHGCRAPG